MFDFNIFSFYCEVHIYSIYLKKEILQLMHIFFNAFYVISQETNCLNLSDGLSIL